MPVINNPLVVPATSAACTIDTLSAAAKCYDCLSSTEKQALMVVFMAAALKAGGGIDLTNINVRNAAAACLACEPDPRLQSMEVALWKSLAVLFGASLPTSISDLRALIKCVPCGEQKTTRAAYVRLLCEIIQLGPTPGVPCWVAREVYGVSNPRWMHFSYWLFTASPLWFVDLYLKYGQRFAKWISGKPRIKSIVRRLMDVVVDRD